ncbi:MAG: hypothetical protein KIT10_03315 [Flavobacteriales bacterium]|nr:hypothetical protein [Flavobacteriales bacterium]
MRPCPGVAPLGFILALLPIAIVAPPSKAQFVEGRVHGAWGMNLLTSPGEDLTSSPGQTIMLNGSITLAGEKRKVLFQPALNLGFNAYRTRMAYRVHFVTERTQLGLDMVLGFPQMSGTILQAGFFAATVTRVNNRIENDAQGVFFPLYNQAQLQRDHFHRPGQAGVILGLAVPLAREFKWGLDLQLRQHLIPLVERSQEFALINRPPQLIMAESTRATILTIGLSYRIGQAAQKG